MGNELQQCITAVLNGQDVQNSQNLIHSFDEGYAVIPIENGEKSFYDQFAAGQASKDNYSVAADFLTKMSRVSDPEITAYLQDIDSDSGPSAELSINGNKYDADPNTAILYATVFEDGGIETDDSVLESLSDGDVHIKNLPDEENWFVPDRDEMDFQDEELSGNYQKVLNFDGYDVKAQQTKNGMQIQRYMNFESERDSFSLKMPNVGRASEDQMKRDMKKKMNNGEFNQDSVFSPSAIAAWPEEDLEIEDLGQLDVYSAAVAVMDEEDIETQNYAVADGALSILTEMNGDAAEAPMSFVGAMYPALEDTLLMKESDLRKNLGRRGVQ